MKHLHFSTFKVLVIFMSLFCLNSCATFEEVEPLEDNYFTDETLDLITMTSFGVTQSYVAFVNFTTDYNDLAPEFQEKITKVAVFLNGQRIYLLPLGQNYFTEQLQSNKSYNLSMAFYSEEGATYNYVSHDFDTF